METPTMQFVDPEVTQQKFTEELAKYSSAKEHYRKMGVLLLEESYPNLYFGFVAPSLSPAPIIFAVKINFDNYDVQPLSVKFVHPLTFQPMLMSQMHTRLPRKLENSPLPHYLLQSHNDAPPFFCIPGVREYHDHTFHTGDSWFLYRKKGGEGSLCFILDNLQLYGTSHIRAYQFQIQLAAQNPNANLFSDPNSLPL
jgi:hypothetical protein